MIDNSKNYSQVLPKCVGVYKNRRKLKIAIIGYNEDIESRSLRSLRNHFKCPLKYRQCYETFDDYKDLVRHLHNYHINQKFHCIYCKPFATPNEIEIRDQMDAKQLAKHMIEVHRHRRYQCNLCLYRAISPEHVNIHQSIIHSDIHKSTQQHKQLNGKSCKILECPPVTQESVGKAIPSAVDFFRNHKHLRINNNETHNNNYQCVYCDYMNENRSLVVQHCVQTHPDYLVLYYVPECDAFVTSSRSPQIQTQYQEMDMFGEANREPQDNRVSSTDDPGLKDYVKENAFTKKQRVSAVQSDKQPSRLSNKNLNKDNYQPNMTVRHLNPSKHAMPPRGPSLWRPNQQNSRPMPKSAKERLRLQFPILPKRGYISGDESDENTPKKVRKPSTSATNKATLPVLLSPQKEKIDRKMVCQVCTGSEKELTESQIGSHLIMYQKNHKIKPNKNLIPYMCGYCKSFFDIEGTGSIIAHQRILCRKRPENGKEGNIEKLIIPRDEYYKKKFGDKPIDKSNKRFESKQMSPKKVGKKPRYTPLSEDEYEELEHTKRTRTDNSSKFVDYKRKYQNKVEKQSSTERDSKRLNRISESKQNKSTSRQKSKPIKKSPKDYHSSDDESISSIAETDEDLMRPSTSRMTTTIETVYPQSDEEDSQSKSDRFVCLFCDQTFAVQSTTAEHLETHLPELHNAIDDIRDSRPVRHWLNLFPKKQSDLLLEADNDSEGYRHYECPVCVKMGELKGVTPKQFKTFWELRVHFWEHTLWKPVKCLKCIGDHYLANCDHLIARHLNVSHHDDLIQSKKYWINQLVGDKVKNFFNPEQRRSLEIHGFIETRPYEPLDKVIADTLKQISDKHESDLRQKAEKDERKSITLPNLILEPLPALNFDDEDMVSDYLVEYKRKSREKRILKKTQNQSQSKKPIDNIDIGSSTDEDSDDEQLAFTRKNKPNLFDDSDDERSETINRQLIEDSDDEIEVLEEITSTSQTYDKQKSESSEESDNEESNDSTDKPNKRNSKEKEEEIDFKSEQKPKINELTEYFKPEENVIESGTDSAENSINESKESPNEVTNISNSPVKRCRCGICKEEFENKKQFIEHARMAHPQQSSRYEKI